MTYPLTEPHPQHIEAYAILIRNAERRLKLTEVGEIEAKQASALKEAIEQCRNMYLETKGVLAEETAVKLPGFFKAKGSAHETGRNDGPEGDPESD